MTTQIWAVANDKGGVGKTATTLGIATKLAQRNKKTLIIDLDHQASASRDLGRDEEDYTISDLFEDRKFDLSKIIYPAKSGDEIIENLFVIPADTTLSISIRGAERFVHRTLILHDALQKLLKKEHFDYVLLDLRPAIDLGVENALCVADYFIIPVEMDDKALNGIEKLFEFIKEVKRCDDFVYTLVKTKRNGAWTKVNSLIDGIIADKGYKAATTHISTSTEYASASVQRIPATLAYPKGKPSKDYEALTEELLSITSNLNV